MPCSKLIVSSLQPRPNFRLLFATSLPNFCLHLTAKLLSPKLRHIASKLLFPLHSVPTFISSSLYHTPNVGTFFTASCHIFRSFPAPCHRARTLIVALTHRLILRRVSFSAASRSNYPSRRARMLSSLFTASRRNNCLLFLAFEVCLFSTAT
jgi:hypothetical protein